MLNFIRMAVIRVRFGGYVIRVMVESVVAIDYVADTSGEIRQSNFAFGFGFNVTFPNCNDSPTLGSEHLLDFGITLTVAVDFGLPKFWVCGRKVRIFASFVAMPKAPMHENYDFVTAKNDVGLSGEFGVMQAVAVAEAMQITTHKHFRLSVFTFDCRHTIMALLRCHYIRHIVITCNPIANL